MRKLKEKKLNRFGQSPQSTDSSLRTTNHSLQTTNRQSLIAYRQSGFTLIELLVVTGIIAILTGIVTVNFSTQRSQQELTASAEDIVSRIRQVQSNVLSGVEVASGQTPASYDIIFTDDQNTFQIDNPITSAETVTLSQNTSVVNIRVDGNSASTATINYSSPFGRMTINGTPNIIARITVRHTKTGNQKVILIDANSGRIDIQ